MLFNLNNRHDLRQTYFTAWQKHKSQQPLEPLEATIIDILLLHPEYHNLLDHPDTYQDKDYTPEQGKMNPFLHLSLHMALQEQLSTNRPQGISAIYQKLCKKHGDPHEVQHKMLECLGESLFHAMQQGIPPDEQHYLEALKRL